MALFPIFLHLQGLPCLVVGGGKTAARKIERLLIAHAQVTVISPHLSAQLQTWVAEGRITYHTQLPTDIDLTPYRLVIAATSDSVVNQMISQQAHQQGVLINVVDQPNLCNFIVPAVIDRSPIQVAISSGGQSPMLARLLRARLESLIPATYGRVATFAAHFRARVKEHLSHVKQRRRFWEKILQSPIVDMVLAGQEEAAAHALEIQLQQTENSLSQGEVYLVGAGPGDPDLLTFRALRLMQQADVVVYDRLISTEILNLVRREAERIFVGKSPHQHTLPQADINHLLLALAKQGKRVLRLKGGDPFIFGRGGEEIETLLEQGIPFQVVPGITAALGVAAYAGIPLTHRDYAQSCVFVTGHLKDGSMNLNWSVLTQPQQTVVVYMGLTGIQTFCTEMIKHGMPPDAQAALIQQATTPHQKVIIGTLSTLPMQVTTAQIRSPSLILVGEVVKLHQKLAWFKSG